MRAFTRMWDRITLERYGVQRREAPPLPLRRAGELARAHRGAAREQRAADRARDARRDAVEGRRGRGRSSCRAGTRRSACPVRGTSSGRCGCSRCSRSSPTCSSTTTSSRARRSSRPRPPSSSTRPKPSCQWVLDGGGAFEMIDEMKGRLVQSHAERVRHIESGEIEVVGVNVLHRDRAVAARRPATRAHPRRSTRRPRPSSSRACGGGATSATTAAVDAALELLRETRRHRREPDAGHDRRWPRRAGPSASGRPRCARCSASTGRRPASARSPPPRPATCSRSRDACQEAARRARRARCGSSSASPGSTATRTAPSRSRSRRATPAWRSCTRASGSRPPRSPPRRATRTSTSSGLSILSGSHLELVPETVAAPPRRGGRRPGRRRRDHPGRRPGEAARSRGRRPRLHAQGLPPRRDHPRHRRPRDRPPAPRHDAPQPSGAAAQGARAPGAGILRRSRATETIGTSPRSRRRTWRGCRGA